MKLSFSTLGCPNWMWTEITSAALDLGYRGIELRGLGDDLFVPQVKIFMPENVAQTSAALKRQGLEISCVSTDCLFHDPQAEVEKNCPAYIDLASALGCDYIRVLCDTWVEPDEKADIELAARRLTALAPYAKERGVVILVETNGVLSDTKKLKKLLETVGHPNVQALWDINHPIRNYGESIEETWSNIGAYVRHVHMKDSVVENGKLKYKMLGYGDLPLSGIIKLLKDSGYGGYLSLEWTKRWNDELEDAGIVFAHFIYQMKKMLKD